MNGFLFINKEKGMTSFDVIKEVRKIFKMKKVGHAGTLDKLATGLLIIAMGEATKLLEFLIGCNKVYKVVAKFGYVSDTYDLDGEINEVDLRKAVSKEVIEKVIKEKFVGKISQMPPKYSALKVQGKRASDLVREGKEVELKPREIVISEFIIISYQWPLVEFEVACGSGTYIRSLINDLGEVLECGALVSDLQRTSVDGFKISESVLLSELSDDNLISMERVAEKFEKRELKEEELKGLQNGKVLQGIVLEKELVMAFYKGKLVGVLENFKDGVKFRKLIQ